MQAIAALVAAAAIAPLHVTAADTIGPYKIEGGTFARAVTIFGKPTSTRETESECIVTWSPIGLQMRFYTLFYKHQCDRRSAFELAQISGPWQTSKGLRRGDPVSRIHTLYPKTKPVATPFPSSSFGLALRSNPAIGLYGLAVTVRDGRAASLFLLNPQGGE